MTDQGQKYIFLIFSPLSFLIVYFTKEIIAQTPCLILSAASSFTGYVSLTVYKMET